MPYKQKTAITKGPYLRNRRRYNKKLRNTRTTKIRAYKSSQKKHMVNSMRPMVETKSRTAEELALQINDATVIPDPTEFAHVPNDDALTQIPVWPFLVQHQGLNEDEMIGLSNYTRWMKVKCQIKLPEGVYCIQHPCNVYMVHGWVKSPISATTFTTPKANEVTPAFINDFVAKHVKDFFDEREDKLRFIPKQNTNIKILGYKKLRANKNDNLGTNPSVFSTSTVPTGFRTGGANSIINYSATWKVMRKIHYTHGAQVGGSGPGTGYQTLYPNSSYLPFLIIYNPTFGSFQSGEDYKIQIAHNSSVWYSDQ